MKFTAISVALLATGCVGAWVDVFSANTTLGDKNYFCTKIPSVTKMSSGALIAMGEARIGSCADVAGTDLVYRRSWDGGKTWDSLRIMHSNSSEENHNVVGNAAPVIVRSTGRLIVPFNRNNEETWITYSDDEGETWATPKIMPHLQESAWSWIGLGPPAGLQLASGRLLIPGYHSDFWPDNSTSLGSGFTKGHTLISDDDGETWEIGCRRFGEPYFANEDQAVQLADGRVVINSRTLSDHRALSYSSDEGETFDQVLQAPSLHQTFQGCEGSFINIPQDDGSDRLFYSGVQGRLPARIYRENLTIWESLDGGESFDLNTIVTLGSSAYSSLVAAPRGSGTLGILFERSTCTKEDCPLVFQPDYISFDTFDI